MSTWTQLNDIYNLNMRKESAECPFCGTTFKPRVNKTSSDIYYYQEFCSRLCKKLKKQEDEVRNHEQD